MSLTKPLRGRLPRKTRMSFGNNWIGHENVKGTVGYPFGVIAHYKMNENAVGGGIEIVNNGTFASDTGWTKGTGWTIAGGVASFAATGSLSNLYQYTGLVVGRTYTVTFTLQNWSAGNVRIYCGSGNSGLQRSGDNTYGVDMLCEGDNRVILQADETFTGDIDNVSIKPCACEVEDSSGNDHEGQYRRTSIGIETFRGAAPLLLNTALVTFIFDDGVDTDYDVMKPVFDAQGEVACCAIILNRVGTAGKLTEAELVEMEGDGWEMLGHTVTHPYLTTLSEADLVTELSDSKTGLEAMGLTIRHFVYPYGDFNSAVIRATKDYYEVARGSGGLNQQILDNYALSGYNADDHTLLETYQGYVDTAETEKKWLIFYLHETDADDATAISTLIDYIQAKGISIVTVSEALALATSLRGKINGALSFGNAYNNVVIADHDDFSPVLTPFSISAWIYMIDATNFFIASKGVSGSTGEWLFYCSSIDRPLLKLYDQSATASIARRYNAGLASYENQWVHLVGTYDGGILSDGIKLYLNGVRIDDNSEDAGTFEGIENLGATPYIGKYANSCANGLIDNLIFWNRELSGYEASRQYQSRFSAYRKHRHGAR